MGKAGSHLAEGGAAAKDATKDADRPAGGAQSIRRAVVILRTLAAGGAAGMRMRDVTRTTGLNHATTHRMLHVLLEEGIVEQDAKTRRYMIGEQIPLLALARPAASPLQSAASPWLRRAAHELGDTAFLTLRTGLDTLCVARQLGSFPVQVLMIDAGVRRPLGVSSAGMAILANLPEAQAQDVLEQNQKRMMAYRMTVPRAMNLVAETRQRGYALRQRGLVAGTKAISVCLCGTNASPVAALTIAAVDRRMSADRIVDVVAYLQKAALSIEQNVRA